MQAETAATTQVIVNQEEQYSLWPLANPIPEGWSAAGFSGSHEDCVSYVDRVWTDMRPLSIR